MRKRQLISVIVPVYNVENYIGQCLDSLIQQTYSELEILCIDDGSTDSSGAVCDAYARNDSRIKVIHTSNQGSGAAKNIGLSAAGGEYIAFVDSDDYIDRRMFGSLYDLAQNQHADIVSCNLAIVYQDKVITDNHIENIKTYSGEEFLKMTAVHWKYYIHLGKIFDKKLLSGAVFPEDHVIDDGFFTYKIISAANKIVWTDESLYFYRQRKSSVMNVPEYAVQRNHDAIKLAKDKLEFVKQNHPGAAGIFEKKLIDTFLDISYKEGRVSPANKKTIGYIWHNCRHALFVEYTFRESLWIIVFLHFPQKMIQRHTLRISDPANNREEGILFD